MKEFPLFVEPVLIHYGYSKHKAVQKRNPNIKSDTKLINMLRQAIDASEEDDGWAQLGPIGKHI
jgi:hypothetical protein